MDKDSEFISEEKKEVDKLSWQDMYELTKNYYECYGDIAVAPEFKTLNGYEENEKGVSLLDWIEKQFQKIRSKSLISQLMVNVNISDEETERLEKLKQLTDEQVLSLACIGFRTDTYQANYDRVKEFLIKYGVTDPQILFSLRVRSYIELCAIEDYLISENIPVYENGGLNPIFYMSGNMLKAIYGFYKHELITSYIAKLDKDSQKKLVL